jgi:hypothetical protein
MDMNHWWNSRSARSGSVAAAAPIGIGRELVLGLAALVAVMAMSPQNAFAVEVQAHHAGPKVAKPGAQMKGTSDFEVYTEGDDRNGKKVGPNASSSHFKTGGKPNEDIAPPRSAKGQREPRSFSRTQSMGRRSWP